MARFFSILLTAAGFFATLTFGFAVPILCRPFYYLQIKLLHLEEASGFSYDTIKTAFDEVMDYLILNTPFGTGELAWSASGKSHFADCQTLFRLNFIVLAVSAAVILILLILHCRGKLQVHRFRGRSPFFYTGLLSLLLISGLGCWGLLSFNTLFVSFHTAFFPGKSNWIFDPSLDEIILILPEQFFFNCVILILLVILTISLFFLFHGKKNQLDTI